VYANAYTVHLEGLATKHGDEKTRIISQVIALPFLKERGDDNS